MAFIQFPSNQPEGMRMHTVHTKRVQIPIYGAPQVLFRKAGSIVGLNAAGIDGSINPRLDVVIRCIATHSNKQTSRSSCRLYVHMWLPLLLD